MKKIFIFALPFVIMTTAVVCAKESKLISVKRDNILCKHEIVKETKQVPKAEEVSVDENDSVPEKIPYYDQDMNIITLPYYGEEINIVTLPYCGEDSNVTELPYNNE